ncbi:hypothetical protein PINS_up005781 [Pythium insidiosum]|nr:hypothetical protein PINS_up005781 [Pythium insidiosum]
MTTLRRRHANASASAAARGETTPEREPEPERVKLTRKQSWHEQATDHVLSHRRYSVLMGALLGIAGFALLNVLYLEHEMPEVMQLPAESMKLLREKFKSEWSKRVSEDLLAGFDYRPLLSSAAEDRPGLRLHRENVTAHAPVVMLPGFTSTGLEIWNGSECSKAYFRQRMWGTTRMLQQFMMNQVRSAQTDLNGWLC